MELLRVRASDIDERARLSFSIYGSVDPASMRLFRVNPGTGVVYTADRLDYEARTQHILTIMVGKEAWMTICSCVCVSLDVTVSLYAPLCYPINYVRFGNCVCLT